jgi:hypothetical protein
VNPRERWQALQGTLTAARSAVERGDRAAALAAVNAALELDPQFLAAHSLRDRIVAGDMPTQFQSQPYARPAAIPPTTTAAIAARRPASAAAETRPVALTAEAGAGSPTAKVTPASLTADVRPVPPAVEARPIAAVEGYAKFEQRAKRRRVDRRIDAARQAIERKHLKHAAAALDEVIELDPNLPELTDLTVQFDALRRSATGPHRGPWFAAAAVLAGSVFGASWLQDSTLPLLSRSRIAVVPLLAAPTSSVRVSADAEPIPTTGVMPAAESTAPLRRVAAPVVEPPPVVPAVATAAYVRPSAEPIAELPAALPAPQPPPQQPPVVVAAPRPAQESPVAAAVSTAAVSTAAVSIPVPPKVEDVDEHAMVRQTLQRYRSAYERLDARSAHAVWPAVNQAALARAFEGLQSQTITFDACDVRVGGDAAAATCKGSARYVPKIGNREPRTEPRLWSFTLHKDGPDWKIDSARAER